MGRFLYYEGICYQGESVNRKGDHATQGTEEDNGCAVSGEGVDKHLRFGLGIHQVA